LTNKRKQRAQVFSTFWEGPIDVAVAPPGNVKAALTAAMRIANKSKGLSLSYLDLVPMGVCRIEWGDIVVTKAFVKEAEKALRPSKTTRLPNRVPEVDMARLEPSPRCSLCDATDPGNPCRECGHDSTTDPP
jgi:hypothetical protein